ncbi:hypothetical protein EON65_11800, partial [archaeon]
MKVRVYEKEEKRETKRTLEHPLDGAGGGSGKYVPTEPSTPAPSTPVGAGGGGNASSSPDPATPFEDNNPGNRLTRYTY